MTTLTDSVAADAAVLLDHVLEVFKRALRQHRGLVPCAVALTTTGELTALAADAGGEAEVPETIELLAAMLVESRAEWRSAALGFAVTDAAGIDLIEIHCDFADGSTGLVAAVPYQPGGLWREPSWGAASWRLLPKFVWVDQIT